MECAEDEEIEQASMLQDIRAGLRVKQARPLGALVFLPRSVVHPSTNYLAWVLVVLKSN